MKRKILAMFLAFSMIFGSIGTVFAEEKGTKKSYDEEMSEQISSMFNNIVKSHMNSEKVKYHAVLDKDKKEADIFISNNYTGKLLKDIDMIGLADYLLSSCVVISGENYTLDDLLVKFQVENQEAIDVVSIAKKHQGENQKDLAEKELKEKIISQIGSELKIDADKIKLNDLTGKELNFTFQEKDHRGTKEIGKATFKVLFHNESNMKKYKAVFRQLEDGQVALIDKTDEFIASKGKLDSIIKKYIEDYENNNIKGYKKVNQEIREENGVSVIYYDFKEPETPSGKIKVTFKLPDQLIPGAEFTKPLEYTPDYFIKLHGYRGIVSLTYLYDKGISANDIKVPTMIGSSRENIGWNPEIKGNLFRDTVYEVKFKGLEEEKPEGKRVKGKDRIETAIEISKDYFGSAENVIVVDASNFPDAMTASVLAKQLKAPILLTNSKTLDSRVKAEIERLGASDVVIVGGTSSISEAVKNELKEFDEDGVDRIYGKDRYETSAKVAKKVVEKTGKLEHAVIASGQVFADALTVGPYAAREGYPILLVKENVLPKSVKDAITELDIKQVSIAGGTSSVSKELESSLPTVAERLSGKNRYETAMDIAVNGIKKSDEIFVANGEKWMDALVIGPVGGMLNMPILLTGVDNAPQSLKDYIAKAKVQKLTAVGGDSMISESLLQELTK